MKKVESVWAELSARKTKLSSKKVNLKVTDDLEDQIFLMERAIEEANAVEEKVAAFEQQLDSVMKSAREIVGSAKDVIKLIESTQSDSYQNLDEFDRLANELGIQGLENDSYRNLLTLIEDEGEMSINKLAMYIRDIEEYNLI